MLTVSDMRTRVSIFGDGDAGAAASGSSDNDRAIESAGRFFADGFRARAESYDGGAVVAPDMSEQGELNLDGGFRPEPEPHADTVAGSTATAATIAVGGSAAVTIDTVGDRDWYRVTLTAGTTYTIHTSSLNGANADSYLRLRDASGTLITEDDDGGANTYSLISYTPSSSGTFYIDAGTYNDSSTGSFHLSVAASPSGASDVVGGTTGTASSLTVGGSINGRIDTNGDHDFYAITLTAGQTYIFRTGGVTSSTSTDTVLTLRNSAGTLLQTNDDSGEGSFSAIRYTVTTTGTYYLDVSGFGSATGNFNLTAFTTPTPTVYTLDQIADQLTAGYWGGGTHRFNVSPGGTITVNITALTAAGQSLAQAALLLWTDAMGVTFSEVSSGGQIVFDDDEDGAYGGSTFSGGFIISSVVNVGLDWLTAYGTGLYSYSFQTYIHEIGHALGLGHAGNYDGAASYAADSLYLNDSWGTTIMSYFNQSENDYFAGMGFTTQFSVTPMLADLVAVSDLYGTPSTTRTGNTVYGFNSTSNRSIHDASLYANAAYTIVDHGGTDTLDYSGFSTHQTINLNAETFSSVGSRVGNVSIARGTVIENANGGSGNDTITGNSAANTLNGNGGIDTIHGGDGNDIIDGGAGADTMSGGAGSDAYYVDDAGDMVIEAEAGTAAVDGIYARVSYTIPNGQEIERMAAVPGSDPINLTGNSYRQRIIGNDGPNTLMGGGGADTLRGFGGADILIGSSANEKFTGGAGADRFVIAGNSGTDLITDFEAGIDKIDLSALGATWQQISSSMTLNGDITQIALPGGNALWLRDVPIASLDADDFLFVEESSGSWEIEEFGGEAFRPQLHAGLGHGAGWDLF